MISPQPFGAAAIRSRRGSILKEFVGRNVPGQIAICVNGECIAAERWYLLLEVLSTEAATFSMSLSTVANVPRLAARCGLIVPFIFPGKHG